MSQDVVEIVKNEDDKNTLMLKEAIDKKDVASIWENEQDYDKLSSATIKTMQYINEEQVKQFAQKLTQTNEEILNMTFEGVKKRHEKEIDEIEKKYQRYKGYIPLAGVFGFILGILAAKYFFKV